MQGKKIMTFITFSTKDGNATLKIANLTVCAVELREIGGESIVVRVYGDYNNQIKTRQEKNTVTVLQTHSGESLASNIFLIIYIPEGTKLIVNESNLWLASKVRLGNVEICNRHGKQVILPNIIGSIKAYLSNRSTICVSGIFVDVDVSCVNGCTAIINGDVSKSYKAITREGSSINHLGRVNCSVERIIENKSMIII